MKYLVIDVTGYVEIGSTDEAGASKDEELNLWDFEMKLQQLVQLLLNAVQIAFDGGKT